MGNYGKQLWEMDRGGGLERRKSSPVIKNNFDFLGVIGIWGKSWIATCVPFVFAKHLGI